MPSVAMPCRMSAFSPVKQTGCTSSTAGSGGKRPPGHRRPVRNDPAYRAACGWADSIRITGRSTVCRVFGELAANLWLLRAMLVAALDAVGKSPGFGDIAAADATGVPAYAA